jgi:hypothetical protein
MGGQTDKTASGGINLSRGQKVLVGLVSVGVVGITGLGFAGSYTAVVHLAQAKGFGWFAHSFPLGVDAGIGVFLALDLLLAGLKMPYAPLRPFAWFLTGCTVVFNASVSWGDPLAVGMHAVIPTLFVTAVEAARHAVARIARISTDRYIESPPLIRWLLAPLPTYILWRRMRMWQLASYLEIIRIQTETESFKVRMRARHGWRWRRRISESERLALRLSRYGTPVSVTLSAEKDRIQAVSAPLSAPVRPAVPASAHVSLVKSVPTSGRVRQIGTANGVSALVRELVSAGHTDPEIKDLVSVKLPDTRPDSLTRIIHRVRNARTA